MCIRDSIGPEYIVLGVQEFGPLMVCITLAMRVGAGFSAELAALSAEQTLGALQLFKTDPVKRLLTPMAVALPLGAVALGLIGIVVWELCGIVTLMLRSQVNPFTFLHPEAVTSSMLVLSLAKTASFGVLIYLGAATAALRASAVSSGSEAVGRATQHAVVLLSLIHI